MGPEPPAEAIHYSLERQTMDGWVKCSRDGRDWWTVATAPPLSVAETFGPGTYRAHWTKRDRRGKICHSLPFRAEATQRQQQPIQAAEPARPADDAMSALLGQLAPVIDQAVASAVAAALAGQQRAHRAHPEQRSPLEIYRVLRKDAAEDTRTAREMDREASNERLKAQQAMFASLLEQQSAQSERAIERERANAKTVADQVELLQKERLELQAQQATNATAQAVATITAEQTSPEPTEIEQTAAQMQMYAGLMGAAQNSSVGQLLTKFLEAEMMDNLGLSPVVEAAEAAEMFH